MCGYITHRIFNVWFRHKHKLSFLCMMTLFFHLPELISTTCTWTKIKGNESFVCQGEILENLEKLTYNEDEIVYGGLNHLYKIELNSLQDEQMQWDSTLYDKEICRVKWGTQESDLCNNYIRIYDAISTDHYLVCGTHCLRPLCRIYKKNSDGYEIVNEFSAEGLCKHRPLTDSTATVIDGKIFAGTHEGEIDVYPVIQSKHIKTTSADELQESVFVGSFQHDKFVYFFFREANVELDTGKKVIYSKVARVCINDKGYKMEDIEKWTSFFKSRLICVTSGINPYFYDQIQAISKIVNGDNEIFYGIFNSDEPLPISSAICAFSMKDIQNVFDGDFKGTEGPVSSENIPIPRPGTCADYSSGVSEELKNFLITHAEMNNLVYSYLKDPVLINQDFRCRYTSIFVDPQVRSLKDKLYDILYIGTECGTVKKALSTYEKGSNAPKIIETFQLFPDIEIVKSVHIYKEKLLVQSTNMIIIVNTDRCKQHTCNCTECIRLRDPYYAWNMNKSKCEKIYHKRGNDVYLQDVENTGEDETCCHTSNSESNLLKTTTGIEIFKLSTCVILFISISNFIV
ncbi:semaphorin-1A-like isoform X2 [Centruroides sculpturatus]|uniref:semaphorin-1A-like isoform X1 n=1 Tax=Centruroides sculpturatus TaxID=218467 RepID=UPI000C6D32BC|nr:semaphorin-1A-like isoform X1 [Centruroides sculpturatus]XP_023230386.1 semaphorin-1A-like isoform X2 [Centruroides sculpturatus]